MTMSLSCDNGLDSYCTVESQASDRSSADQGSRLRPGFTVLIDTKLRLPEAAKKEVNRPRLVELLERSTRDHAGTLMIGRAGSGKTVLAAHLARKFPDAGWYAIDAGDGDWAVFARYFRAMVAGADAGWEARAARWRTPLEMFVELLATLDADSRTWPRLLVLDGVDHLYDSDWFGDFFSFLMASLPPHAHILVLGRTRPPTPLWRLRSKQLINVVDEKLLAFSLPETVKLFELHGRPSRREAAAAHKECYGRPGKLMRFLES